MEVIKKTFIFAGENKEKTQRIVHHISIVGIANGYSGYNENEDFKHHKIYIMAKIKYKACENKKTGTHSFFAQPVYSGTLTMKELCKEAFDGKAIEESTAKAAIEEFMKAVQRNLLKGFRCQIGEDFLTVYPNLQLSVKDKQENGQLIVATANMLKANNAISRLGCTVHPKYSKEFANGVQWQKVDGNGTPIEEDDITQGNENISGGEPSGNGGNSGGNAGGNNNGGEDGDVI